LNDPAETEWASITTVVQEVRSPLIPEGAHVMTVLISHPPGAPGYPPHRLPGGPGFGYMIDGEMLFELEGEAPRVLRAGDAFWGAGGDAIHYQDANNREDIPCSFVLTLFCLPGRPMLEWVTRRELDDRKGLRLSISPSIDGHVDTTAAWEHTGMGAAMTRHESEYGPAQRWSAVTRGLVLLGATATVVSDQRRPRGSISITVTGAALSIDLLLADTGIIALASLGGRADARVHPMRVVPMQLDMLSDAPTICVRGRGMTEATQFRLVVELTARDPQTDAMSVITCKYSSVLLNPSAPLALMDFQPQQVTHRVQTA
jgi:quercetin dioxygenase-like cupin family protein